MMPSSIVQPASAGLREGAPRAGTVQPVKSLPLKSGFHGSADCSDATSWKQSSVTMPNEMPFIANPPTLEFPIRKVRFTDENVFCTSAYPRRFVFAGEIDPVHQHHSVFCWRLPAPRRNIAAPMVQQDARWAIGNLVRQGGVLLAIDVVFDT